MGIVDGSSWRTSSEMSYPGFLLVGGEFENVRGKKKKSKIWLRCIYKVHSQRAINGFPLNETQQQRQNIKKVQGH